MLGKGAAADIDDTPTDKGAVRPDKEPSIEYICTWQDINNPLLFSFSSARDRHH